MQMAVYEYRLSQIETNYQEEIAHERFIHQKRK